MKTGVLHQLIRDEIARRTEASISFDPFSFIVNDAPGALTDVAAAVRAIEAGGDRVTIAPGIRADVEAALAATHPKRFAKPGIAIIARTIVKPGDVPVPQTAWYYDGDQPSGWPLKYHRIPSSVPLRGLRKCVITRRPGKICPLRGAG